MRTVGRRRSLALVAALPLLVRPSAAADVRRYAALSLLADRLEVVYAREGAGSHFDRNGRRSHT